MVFAPRDPRLFRQLVPPGSGQYTARPELSAAGRGWRWRSSGPPTGGACANCSRRTGSVESCGDGLNLRGTWRRLQSPEEAYDTEQNNYLGDRVSRTDTI